MIVRACLLIAVAALCASTAPSTAAFRLFDDFEDEAIGPIAGQDGWVSSGGDNRIVADPADPGNQVLYVPSDSSILRKSLMLGSVGVPDGTSRMLFMRFRVANKQTFSVGLSGLLGPTEFSDFAPEIGNSTPNLDLRCWDNDGGNYEVLARLTAGCWYNLWVQVDTLNNEYRVWMNQTPGASAAPSDQLRAPDGDETFGFRSGTQSSLRTFFIKTAGGSSGTNFGPVYFDSIYIENSSALSLWNPTSCGHPFDFDADCDVDLQDLVIFRTCASGPALPYLTGCLLPLDPTGHVAADSDQDGDADADDFGVFQRCYNGPGHPADPACSGG